MRKIAPYAKALTAALVAGLGSLYQALDGDQVITTQEWIAVAMTTLAALGAVFAISNHDPAAQHQDESVRPPQGGAVDVVLLLLIAIFVLVLLMFFGVNAR